MEFLAILLRMILGWFTPPGRMQPIRVRADGSTDTSPHDSDQSVSFQLRLARMFNWYLREGTAVWDRSRLGRLFHHAVRVFRVRETSGRASPRPTSRF